MSDNPTYISSDDSVNPDAWNGNAFGAVVKSRAVAFVAATAVAALSGATVSQVAAYSGTDYNGGGGSCQSFNVSSWGDPHMTSSIGGQQTGTAGANDMGNFSTVYNTQGGTTAIAVTTGQNQNEYIETWNKTITLTHYGANAWTLTATTPDGPTGDTVIQGGDGATYIDNSDTTGQILGYVTTASGSQPVYDGQTLPDGTTINYSQNKALVVTQPLNQGGSVSTNISLTYAADSSAFLNVDQSANGAAIVNGAAFDVADGADWGAYSNGQQMLAMPCSNADSSVTPGTLPDGSSASSAGSTTGPSSGGPTNTSSDAPSEAAAPPQSPTAAPEPPGPPAPPPAPPAPPPPTPAPPAFDTNAPPSAQENS